jgi:hypothetical protein
MRNAISFFENAMVKTFYQSQEIRMTTPLNILILGASYGSLLGTRMAFAGHNVTLVCLPAEANAINAHGCKVRMPVRGREGLVELDSRVARGRLKACGAGEAEPAKFDLVCLAMQEPQYRADGVRELMGRVAASRKPVMSIMNMPPKPFLARLPGVDTSILEPCYSSSIVWDAFDPKLVTLASPDPQAFRPPDEPVNVLQVSLPTNFKVARFEDDAHTRLLERLEADIAASRIAVDGEMIELPVKLKLHSSVYVPLAKWAMLLTGNYRCVGADEVRPIRDAVHADLELSHSIYDWVCAVCVKLGASPDDMVPFEKYANAASGLAKPSSAARALAAGATAIERVDLVVQSLAGAMGMSNPHVDATVANVNGWLERNRQAAVKAG